MTSLGNGFKNIFLAGIGAAAITGEKAKDLVDKMIAQGEITVEQGRIVNEELQHKACDATKNIRESALEARMSVMTPEERDDYVAKVTEIASRMSTPVTEVPIEVVDEDDEAPAAEEKPEL